MSVSLLTVVGFLLRNLMDHCVCLWIEVYHWGYFIRVSYMGKYSLILGLSLHIQNLQDERHLNMCDNDRRCTMSHGIILDGV